MMMTLFRAYLFVQAIYVFETNAILRPSLRDSTILSTGTQSRHGGTGLFSEVPSEPAASVPSVFSCSKICVHLRPLVAPKSDEGGSAVKYCLCACVANLFVLFVSFC